MTAARILGWLARLIGPELRAEWLREWDAERAHAVATSGSVLRVLLTAAEDALRQIPARIEAGAGTQDLRFAVRSLRANPGFALAAVLTLALGIGANTATFSVVNAYLVRPLPLPEPDRVVGVLRARPGAWLNLTSAPNYVDWRERNRSFTDLAAVQLWSVNMTGEGRPRRISRALATPGIFGILGVPPALGRTFFAEEAVQGRDAVAILSYGLWQEVFGGDPAVLGRSIELNDVAHTVVGVLPRGFRAPPLTTDVWAPLAFTEDALAARGRNNLYTVGRLGDGVTLESAQADMAGIAASLAAEYPGPNDGWGVDVRPLHDVAVGRSTTALWTLFGAVGLVLLIACANVANLVIARGAARERELSVRVALGASRGRLMVQLLTESVLIALCGGVLGLSVAVVLLGPIRSLVPAGLSAVGDVTLDGRVLAFTLVVSLVTGLAAGLAPSVRLARSSGTHALAGRLRERAGTGRVRSGLAAVQFTLATVLLIAAGLTVRSLDALSRVDVGVRTAALSSFEVTFPEASYTEPERVIAAIDGIREALESRPDVERAVAVSHLPLSGARLNSSLDYEGGPTTRRNDGPSATIRVATPGYFETLGIPLLSGRVFNDTDRAGSEPVAIINQTAAQRFWPGEDPIGRWIRWANDADGEREERRVVGVVAATRHGGPSVDLTPEVYEPHRQTTDVWRWFGRSMSFVVETRAGALDIETVQDAVAPTDPDLPVVGLATLDQVLARSVATPRFHGTLASTFGALALVLAVIGMYGVLAFTVRTRTRELGIRMALGAGRPRLLREVLMNGVRLAAVGAIAGVVAALALGRVFRALLWGIEPTDPITYAGVVLVLLGATFAASCVPALRASSVDPATSLRAE